MDNPATADLDLAGFRARQAAPSHLGGDYVTRGELDGLIAAISALLALRVDGTNQMLAALRAGNQQIIDLAAGTDDQHAVNLAQLTAAAAQAVTDAQAYANSLLAQGQRFPIGNWSRTVSGTYTFTVGTDCPTWVTSLYYGLSGAGGAAGGSKPPSTYTSSVTTSRLRSRWSRGRQRSVLVPIGWIESGFGGDGATLVGRLDVEDGDVVEIEVGAHGTGGAGGGTSGNDAKDHGAGGGGGGGTTMTHNSIPRIAGGGGGGGGARAGSYDGYGGRGGDGGPAAADGESRTGSAGGLGGTTGTNLHGGLGGLGGEHSPRTSRSGADGSDGETSHVSDLLLAFLFADLLADVGLGGAPNVTDTHGSAQGMQGLPGAAFLRW